MRCGSEVDHCHCAASETSGMGFQMNYQQGMHACTTLEDRGFEAVKLWDFRVLRPGVGKQRCGMREAWCNATMQSDILTQVFVDGVHQEADSATALAAVASRRAGRLLVLGRWNSADWHMQRRLSMLAGSTTNERGPSSAKKGEVTRGLHASIRDNLAKFDLCPPSSNRQGSVGAARGTRTQRAADCWELGVLLVPEST